MTLKTGGYNKIRNIPETVSDALLGEYLYSYNIIDAVRCHRITTAKILFDKC